MLARFRFQTVLLRGSFAKCPSKYKEQKGAKSDFAYLPDFSTLLFFLKHPPDRLTHSGIHSPSKRVQPIVEIKAIDIN